MNYTVLGKISASSKNKIRNILENLVNISEREFELLLHLNEKNACEFSIWLDETVSILGLKVDQKSSKPKL